ncbi:fasciclin domain-containing protein [Sphingobacterium sp. LRF_L2]|uniref:fasciclin domain-containing protein n=1 Tax=Sphingobacterium sp. LRF_L2 TaxID=3369421 RepID=UPI003F6020E1
MLMYFRNYSIYLLLSCCSLIGCRKQLFEAQTTGDVNIVGYLENNSDRFSNLIQILELSEAYGYLNAYGTYTFFAPTNDAIDSYIEQRGKTRIQDIEPSVWKDFVKLHLIRDTISTSMFTDGKLAAITEFGQFLLTGVSNQSGQARYTINRTANVSQANIRTGNGIVHVLDRTIQPATETVAEVIANDPDYTIFTELLRKTGYYDRLNTPLGTDSTWYTVFAQNDETYRTLGFQDYQSLEEFYSNTGNPQNVKDSLNLYAAYHIVDQLDYLADVISTQTLKTLAPLEILTTKLQNTTILINEDTFNGEIEPGVEISRSQSDIQAINGVVHQLLGNVQIKVRQPFAVYWDVTDQPELRKLTSIFRRGKGDLVSFTDTTVFSGIKWQGGAIRYNTTVSTAAENYVNEDFLSMYLRTGAETQWIELKTPLLVKGRYKVWVGFRRARAQTIQVLFNNKLLTNPKLIDVSPYYDYTDENIAESEGYKRYTTVTTGTTSTIKRSMIGRLVGIIDVETTEQHKLKFVSLTNESGAQNLFNLDMIHFIPVDQDQQWPRFRRDGTAQGKTDAP